MTANKVQLQFAQLIRIDVNIRQFAKAGIDSVDGAIFGDDLFDDGARSLDAESCFLRKTYLLPPVCDICYLLKREPFSAELNHRKTEVRCQRSAASGERDLTSDF